MYPTRGVMQLVAVVPLLRALKIPTDIFDPMLDFVFHRIEGLPPTFCSILIFKTHPALLLQSCREDVEKMDTKTSPVSRKCQRGSSFVVVNPLDATPLFSPSSLARAALFGLVVYMPRGRRVAPAQDSPQGAC
ncbi:hypothetical protein DAPPUDRAFT_236588 [Daphnia pulex]|uniref:Uncharacterized protein n=1 Tax=Daphnia pulex TaxID=6669 RepID=E9G1C5_DAPPU|nr:hypothetical protein DAPPUDRAFT_236588 [Daphnia pulex]|eukprot:EFX86642.1 hypothetical protein DAPPUDRAFT_236588 [Daphnia pulex]